VVPDILSAVAGGVEHTATTQEGRRASTSDTFTTPRILCVDAATSYHANEHTPPQVPLELLRPPPRCRLLPRAAHAQSYPHRFVRLIVPFPPCRRRDALARPLAQRLSLFLGPAVIVENRGGAGGMSAPTRPPSAARRPTQRSRRCLSVDQSGRSIHLRLQTVTDLAPISLLTGHSQLMMCPIHRRPFGSLIPSINAQPPACVTFASTGIGRRPHLSGELFRAWPHRDDITAYRAPARHERLLPGRVSGNGSASAWLSRRFKQNKNHHTQDRSRPRHHLGQARRGGAGHPTIGDGAPATRWPLWACSLRPDAGRCYRKVTPIRWRRSAHESVKARYEGSAPRRAKDIDGRPNLRRCCGRRRRNGADSSVGVATLRMR